MGRVAPHIGVERNRQRKSGCRNGLVQSDAAEQQIVTVATIPKYVVPLSLRMTIGFQSCDPLGTDHVHRPAEFLDASREPEQVLLTDPIMLRVARLHIGFLQLLETRLVCFEVARPRIDQAHIDPLGLGTQEPEVVHVGRVEGTNQQHAVIEEFRALMQVERCGL